MATMSAASGTTTITPPSSSHGDQPGWIYAASGARHDHHHEHIPFPDHETNGSTNGALSSQHENAYDPYATDNHQSTREFRSSSRTTSSSNHKRPNRSASPTKHMDEHSKWIHRDKLAKIENEELQAAGIVLPRPRAQSRPRRDRSQDKVNGYRRATDASEQPPPLGSRKNSDLSYDRAPDVESPSWDLRLPDEIAEDPGEYWVRPESRGGSKIPVAKISPAPLPADYIDRDGPKQRKSSLPLLDDDSSIPVPKSRPRRGSSNALEDVSKLQPGKRSATDGSPKKNPTAAARKSSAPAKSGAQGRTKTKSGGPSQRSGSSTRPTTRSGELSPKAPEGTPPWMISSYKPDPRLPPDQQLLPTVAKRLQQEKWEQEGKFGNVYDKEFRPLNDSPFQQRPPELEKPQNLEDQQDEWPLRAGAKSPSAMSRPGTSSYSTMPRIQDKPVTSPIGSPVGSPRPMQPAQMQPQPQMGQNHRTSEAAEQQPQEKPKKEGCGCCIVM